MYTGIKKLNIPLLILPILVFSLGYITLLSTSPEKAQSQLIYFIVGYVIHLAISQIDPIIFKSYWKVFYFTIIGLLTLTFIGGEVHFGSSSWLKLGFFVLQPSEFAKIAAILSISAVIASFKSSFGNLRDITKVTLFILPILLLVLLQPDLGTAIIIFLILVGILYYSGINKIFFLLAFLIFGLFSSPIWNLLKDYQKKRILVFLNPSLDVLGSGYNVIQSTIAIGSAGLFGKGFSMGTQSHLGFLPVYWTDFIFAAFAEEWGFVGVLMLLVLYLVMILIILKSAYDMKDTFGSLVCVGIFITLFSQFLINVGMNLGIMPVTGIPLPLVSYGGSSMISTLMLLGVFQSIWSMRR